jgi:hypothetical protein
MIFHRMPCFLSLILVLCFGCASDSRLGSVVLQSKDLGSLSESMRREGYKPYPDLVPEKLLNRLVRNSDDQQAWKALYHYSLMTDASYSLGFDYDCFMILREHPLLFYNRFLAGDDQAVELMNHAAYADVAAFGRTSDWTREQIRNAFAKIWNEVLKTSDNERHRLFLKQTEERWKRLAEAGEFPYSMPRPD